MNVQILSDLHLYPGLLRSGFVDQFKPTDYSTDLLIIAGDLATVDVLEGLPETADGRKFFDWIDMYENVIYLAGNHEYYTGPSSNNETMEWIDLRISELLPDHVHYVGEKNKVLNIGGKRFVCSTLWAQGSFMTSDVRAIKQSLNDFRCIDNFTYEDMVDLFNKNFYWLIDQFEECDDDTFVITHHLPSIRSVAPQYLNSPINGAFVSDLTALIERTPHLTHWVHGHTHTSFDYTIANTRVICNPVGYTSYYNQSENPEFDPQKIITI